MNKVIGIVSWLPSDDRRQERVDRLNRLFIQLNTYFKLPIMIVAQN